MGFLVSMKAVVGRLPNFGNSNWKLLLELPLAWVESKPSPLLLVGEERPMPLVLFNDSRFLYSRSSIWRRST